jgi:hypothetical protein
MYVYVCIHSACIYVSPASYCSIAFLIFFEASTRGSPCLESDLFSLGCCLYMLGCGLYPFDNQDSQLRRRQEIMQKEIAWCVCSFCIVLSFLMNASIHSFTHIGELDDCSRFFNNYRSVFKHFSQDFQDFIHTILQPEPAQRVPLSPGLLTGPPIARLFRRFPLLFGPVKLSDAEESSIIENMTPSPTQIVLLKVKRECALQLNFFVSKPTFILLKPLNFWQLCESLSAIRKGAALLKEGDQSSVQGKKRQREDECRAEGVDAVEGGVLKEDADKFRDQLMQEMFQSLVDNLQTLRNELQASPGTPAVHMYSILDQIAALHDDFSHRNDLQTLLQEIDDELIRLLQQCLTDVKRNQVHFHQCSSYICALNSHVWLLGQCSSNLWLRFPPLSLGALQFCRSDQAAFDFTRSK